MASFARQPVADRIEGDGVLVRTLDPAGQWYIGGSAMAPNSVVGPSPLVLWLAPDRRLVVAEGAAAPPEGDFVSDVTDGLVVIEVSGPRAADLLAMGTALDPAALAPGHCAQTAFAGVKIVLYRHGETVRLHVERPLAPWLLDWFRQAATAFG